MRKAMMSHQQLATQWLRGQSLSPGNRHAAPHCRAGVVVHPNTGCSPSQALPTVFTGIQGEAMKSGERLSTVLTHKRKQSLSKSTSTWRILRNAATMWHLFPLLQRKFYKMQRGSWEMGPWETTAASQHADYRLCAHALSGAGLSSLWTVCSLIFFLDLLLLRMYKCLPICCQYVYHMCVW